MSSRKLHIAGLNKETLTEETLKQMFKPYGECTNIEIVRDLQTSLPKGYAFVMLAPRAANSFQRCLAEVPRVQFAKADTWSTRLETERKAMEQTAAVKAEEAKTALDPDEDDGTGVWRVKVRGKQGIVNVGLNRITFDGVAEKNEEEEETCFVPPLIEPMEEVEVVKKKIEEPVAPAKSQLPPPTAKSMEDAMASLVTLFDVGPKIKQRRPKREKIFMPPEPQPPPPPTPPPPPKQVAPRPQQKRALPPPPPPPPPQPTNDEVIEEKDVTAEEPKEKKQKTDEAALSKKKKKTKEKMKRARKLLKEKKRVKREEEVKAKVAARPTAPRVDNGPILTSTKSWNELFTPSTATPTATEATKEAKPTFSFLGGNVALPPAPAPAPAPVPITPKPAAPQQKQMQQPQEDEEREGTAVSVPVQAKPNGSLFGLLTEVTSKPPNFARGSSMIVAEKKWKHMASDLRKDFRSKKKQADRKAKAMRQQMSIDSLLAEAEDNQ